MKHTRHTIRYHDPPGRLQIHTAKSGRRYIMVRAPDGGVKRLYEGSRYHTEKEWRTLRL